MQKNAEKFCRIFLTILTISNLILPSSEKSENNLTQTEKSIKNKNQEHLLKIIQTKFDLLKGDLEISEKQAPTSMLSQIHSYMLDLFNSRQLTNSPQARILANIIDLYRQAKELRSGETLFDFRNKSYLFEINQKIRCVLNKHCSPKSGNTFLTEFYFEQRAQSNKKKQAQANHEEPSRSEMVSLDDSMDHIVTRLIRRWGCEFGVLQCYHPAQQKVVLSLFARIRQHLKRGWAHINLSQIIYNDSNNNFEFDLTQLSDFVKSLYPIASINCFQNHLLGFLGVMLKELKGKLLSGLIESIWALQSIEKLEKLTKIEDRDHFIMEFIATMEELLEFWSLHLRDQIMESKNNPDPESLYLHQIRNILQSYHQKALRKIPGQNFLSEECAAVTNTFLTLEEVFTVAIASHIQPWAPPDLEMRKDVVSRVLMMLSIDNLNFLAQNLMQLIFSIPNYKEEFLAKDNDFVYQLYLEILHKEFSQRLEIDYMRILKDIEGLSEERKSEMLKNVLEANKNYFKELTENPALEKSMRHLVATFQKLMEMKSTLRLQIEDIDRFYLKEVVESAKPDRQPELDALLHWNALFLKYENSLTASDHHFFEFIRMLILKWIDLPRSDSESLFQTTFQYLIANSSEYIQIQGKPEIPQSMLVYSQIMLEWFEKIETSLQEVKSTSAEIKSKLQSARDTLEQTVNVMRIPEDGYQMKMFGWFNKKNRGQRKVKETEAGNFSSETVFGIQLYELVNKALIFVSCLEDEEKCQASLLEG